MLLSMASELTCWLITGEETQSNQATTLVCWDQPYLDVLHAPKETRVCVRLDLKSNLNILNLILKFKDTGATSTSADVFCCYKYLPYFPDY